MKGDRKLLVKKISTQENLMNKENLMGKEMMENLMNKVKKAWMIMKIFLIYQR